MGETSLYHSTQSKFHKSPAWHPVDRGYDDDRNHGPLCPFKLERGLLKVLNLRVRSSPPDTARPRRVQISDASEEVVQFRRLNLPNSDSYDGSAERTPALPRLTTTSSLHSQGTDIDQWMDDEGWNQRKLLGLSDTIRATLEGGKKLSLTELEDLNFVLDMMVVDEVDAAHKVTFEVIQNARLDKLLVDMIKAYEQVTTSVYLHETGLGPEIETASSLQRYWQSRFKAEYFAIDQYRFERLVTGRLHDVSFSAVASDGLGVWVPKVAIECSEVEGNMRFVPGDWWLNIGCAHRDGIVGAASEKATKGRYGIAALALLTGMEEDLPDGKTVYIREGSASEMHPSLISQCGQKIRILRGFRLKSMRQPRAGVRYDGLYTIHSWSIKLNITTDLYTLRLTLERMPGQKPIIQVLQVPRPSELDDWRLYEQLEKNRIRLTEGKVKFQDWTSARNAEKTERENWRHNVTFKMAIQNLKATGGQSPPAPAPAPPRRMKLSDIDTDLLPQWEVPGEEE